MTNESNILIYQNENGSIKVDVRFEEGELTPPSTVRNYRTVQTEGTREVARDVDFYNLDMIVAIGFRVRSSTGTKFRIWHLPKRWRCSIHRCI